MYALFEKHERPYKSICAKDLSFYPHMHPQVELLYVEKGEIDICIDNSRKSLEPGELAVVFPNLVHSYQSTGSSRVQLLIFQLEFISEYISPLTTTRPRLPFLPCGQLHKDIAATIAQLQNAELADKSLLRGYLLVLMGRLLEHLQLEAAGTVHNTSLMREVLGYLEQHYADNICLESVARALGVSKYSVSRCFSQGVGIGFNNYVNSLRIQHAQTLLAQTDMPIIEIGYAVGFDSSSTFYRSFQLAVGETPGHYRKRARTAGGLQAV